MHHKLRYRLFSQTIYRRRSNNASAFQFCASKSLGLTDDVVNPTVPWGALGIGTNRIACFPRPFAPGGPIARMILLKIVYVLQGWAIPGFLGSNYGSPNCNIACYSRRFTSAEANALMDSYPFHRNRLFLQTICYRGHKPLCRLGALFYTIVRF